MPARVKTEAPLKTARKYSGPPKGSDEAKERMARVRAAQWEKNGLVPKSNPQTNVPPTHPPTYDRN